MKTQVQLIDAKNAGPKKIYLEFLPGYHCKKAQEYYDQDVTDKCTATYAKDIKREKILSMYRMKISVA